MQQKQRLLLIHDGGKIFRIHTCTKTKQPSSYLFPGSCSNTDVTSTSDYVMLFNSMNPQLASHPSANGGKISVRLIDHVSYFGLGRFQPAIQIAINQSKLIVFIFAVIICVFLILQPSDDLCPHRFSTFAIDID